MKENRIYANDKRKEKKNEEEKKRISIETETRGKL